MFLEHSGTVIPFSSEVSSRKLRVKDLQHPRLDKPRRGLQIFDTRVDFPVPVQICGRFLIFLGGMGNYLYEILTISSTFDVKQQINKQQ